MRPPPAPPCPPAPLAPSAAADAPSPASPSFAHAPFRPLFLSTSHAALLALLVTDSSRCRSATHRSWKFYCLQIGGGLRGGISLRPLAAKDHASQAASEYSIKRIRCVSAVEYLCDADLVIGAIVDSEGVKKVCSLSWIGSLGPQPLLRPAPSPAA